MSPRWRLEILMYDETRALTAHLAREEEHDRILMTFARSATLRELAGIKCDYWKGVAADAQRRESSALQVSANDGDWNAAGGPGIVIQGAVAERRAVICQALSGQWPEGYDMRRELRDEAGDLVLADVFAAVMFGSERKIPCRIKPPRSNAHSGCARKP